MDISIFFHKPCKLRLKSGREVYGVIWSEMESGIDKLLFASSGDYTRLKGLRPSTPSGFRPITHELNIDDVVAAEILDNI